MPVAKRGRFLSMEDNNEYVTKKGFGKVALAIIILLAVGALMVVVAGSFCFDHC